MQYVRRFPFVPEWGDAGKARREAISKGKFTLVAPESKILHVSQESYYFSKLCNITKVQGEKSEEKKMNK